MLSLRYIFRSIVNENTRYWDEIAGINSMNSSELWSLKYFGGGWNRKLYLDVFKLARLLNSLCALSRLGLGTIIVFFRNFNNQVFQSTSQSHIDKCNASKLKFSPIALPKSSSAWEPNSKNPIVTNYTSAWGCWADYPHLGAHDGIGGL